MKRLRFFANVLFAAVVVFGFHAIAEASHFRSSQITWEPTGVPNQVEFTIEQGWRWSAFGNPALGTVVAISSFTFGDGTSTPFSLKVEVIDAANDWFVGSTKITHTYLHAGPFTVIYSDCCRIGGLQDGNSGLSESVRTVVDLSLVNSSPVSTMFPIIQVRRNVLNNLTIPIVDADGDTLTCRLSTAAESSLNTISPAGLVLGSNCVITWTPTILGLYALQVTVEESQGGNPPHGSIALDFIIQVVDDIGNPPVCDTPPTPTGTVTVPVGSTYTATIQGSDPDAGEILTLNTSGIPDGATLTPDLPTSSSSPVSSEFSWTPTADDVGPHVLLFSVTDRNLQQTLCSFTMDVPAPEECAAGSYSTTGFEPCTPAPAGSYAAGTGNTSATSCLAGTYQPESGQSSCLAADPGRFVALSGQTEQTSCPVGRYQPNSGQISCLAADPGHYVALSGQTEQTSCPAGRYQPNSGQSSCLAADPGNFVALPEQTAQTPCAPGSYQPDSGQTSCIPASPGYFVADPGAIAQVQCPAGTTSPAGATACNLILFNFTGFFSPVDNPPLVNTLKAGSAVPVKFSLGGNRGLAIFAAGYPKSQTISCTGGTPDSIEETVTAGGSTLTYDATTDQYKYVWKTDKTWKGCRQLILQFTDGTTKTALFQFK